jgi:hypothetical protein
MSGQLAPLSSGSRPPSPHPLAPAPAAAVASGNARHGRAGPDSPWCICGRPREACVPDVVRHLWQGPGGILHLSGQ